jgi:UDP-N-acetylmuramoyl-tripeptide--D-alanyl-D-alanine ligase
MGMSPLFKVSELVEAADGSLLQGDESTVVEKVNIDSRDVEEKSLFVALPGEKTDGHEYVGEAADAGASCVLVSKPAAVAELDNDLAVVCVENTTRALGSVARYHRSRLQDVKVIAITGSVGKTTTKDLAASILEPLAPTLRTHANWNTEIGVPLMLFQLRTEHRYAVLELAMRAKGEIRALTRMAQPHIGVITNIQETHMETLGSQEAIAWAKAELLEELPPEGTAVLNADDPWVRCISEAAPGRCSWYGRDRSSADITAGAIEPRETELKLELRAPNGELHEVIVPLPGQHNVYNVLAAAAVCRELGVGWRDITAGLSNPELTGMRMQVLEFGSLVVLNDAYNANPASSEAALEAFRRLSGDRRQLIVMGDMLELGPREESGHRQLGRALAEEPPARLVAVGERMKWAIEEAVSSGMDRRRIVHCSDHTEAAEQLDSLVEPEDAILVKGSRGIALENVVEHLRDKATRLQ